MGSDSDTRSTAKWLVVLATTMAAAIVVYAAGDRCLYLLGRWLDVGTEPQKTDYVMLLNGDRETRPFKVADLCMQGFATRVLITTTVSDPRSSAPKHHDVIREILLRCGVAGDKITLIDSRVRTTFDEAKTLGDFLSQRPDVRVSVVTNEYHTRRSRWVFAKVLGPKMRQVRFVSAPTDRFNANNWWKNEDGFTVYGSEFFKFGFYQVKYGSGLIWIAALALALITIVFYRRRRANAWTT